VTLPLAEAEFTLADCTSSVFVFDGRESSLGMRIERYCALMGRVRESHNSLSVALIRHSGSGSYALAYGTSLKLKKVIIDIYCIDKVY
jgi:hypothetical protein